MILRRPTPPSKSGDPTPSLCTRPVTTLPSPPSRALRRTLDGVTFRPCSARQRHKGSRPARLSEPGPFPSPSCKILGQSPARQVLSLPPGPSLEAGGHTQSLKWTKEPPSAPCLLPLPPWRPHTHSQHLRRPASTHCRPLLCPETDPVTPHANDLCPSSVTLLRLTQPLFLACGL